MLYDILIIDDDFASGNNSPLVWKTNANKLLLDLIKDNLRVTWTSGEDKDVEKLKAKDMSVVKYIFCDLNLEGTSTFPGHKMVNSKIMRIIEKISHKVSEEQIIIYINSNHLDDYYRDEGVTHLKNALKKDFENKFSVEIIEGEKNDLPPEQKEKLIRHSLGIYLKSMIINKAVEVEGVFDHELGLSNDKIRNMTFDKKISCFQSRFLSLDDNICKQLKDEIKLLQKIRNNLVHKNMSNDKMFDDISTKFRKLFWGIIADNSQNEKIQNEKIQFEKIEDVAKYIGNINVLIGKLDNITSLAKKAH